jgi:two-component system phosphate regulon response regulator PhoB
VLVVDDEPDIAALVAYHLARTGYRVSTAATGGDALAAAARERPALVVLDLMLPDRSGFDVLERLRADDAPAAWRCSCSRRAAPRPTASAGFR